MATATLAPANKELTKMQARLKKIAPHFDSEKKKMELALSLSTPVGVRTLQIYFAGKGQKFSFTKELLEKAEEFMKAK